MARTSIDTEPVAPLIAGVNNLGGLLVRAATLWGDQTAWKFPHRDETLSFKEVERLTRTLAARLSTAGIDERDAVALMAKNTPAYPAVWLALARLGAATVPLNTSYQMTDATHTVEHAGARWIVCMDEYRPLIERVAARRGTVTILSVEELLKDALAADDDQAMVKPAIDRASPGTICNIQYTSGTTGKPKGCVLGHDYWLAIAWTLVNEFPHLDHSDVMLTAQPFHYIDPQWNVVAALLSGAELVILDRFHPTSFWDEVRRHNVTYFYCLGIMPTLLLRMPPSPLDRSSRVRAIQCSAIPPHSHRALEERWGVPWFEAYGTTETGSDLYIGPEDHDATIGTGTTGRPRSHRRIEVVTTEGDRVSPGEVGELLISGYGIMQAYYEDGHAIASTLKDGFYHTGDLVTLDEEGRVLFRGRTKDMIRRSGENIAAAEVEEVLLRHPSVRLVAVLPVADELRGEEVLAVVVAAKNPVTEAQFIDEMAQYCQSELAYFKVPRYWRLTRELPVTASERVRKTELDRSVAGSWEQRAEGWHRHE